MAYDLKAATHAAQTEAQRARFEFEWGDEKFSVPSINEWTLSLQADFLALNTLEENDPAVGERTLAVMQQVIGEDEDEWERFKRTVPFVAIPMLVQQMATLMVGVDTPNLSKQSPPGSTQT